jgi:hypothetical protein
MLKKRRLIAWIGGGLLLLIVGGAFVLYRASQYEPAFYRAALQGDPTLQRKASDEMLQRAAALVSDVNTKNRWQALFTAEQINGWLAVDLVKNHSNSLPPGFHDPRVAIEPDQVTLACSFQISGFTSILTLTLQPYLSAEEPDVVAVEIVKVRAGRLPLPLGKVVEAISEAARISGVALKWRRGAGGPAALISMPQPSNAGNKVLSIETMEIKQDEVFVAGKSERK